MAMGKAAEPDCAGISQQAREVASQACRRGNANGGQRRAPNAPPFALPFPISAQIKIRSKSGKFPKKEHIDEFRGHNWRGG